MVDYSTLDIGGLFERYVIYDDEREGIDAFAESLPEPGRSEFLGLKRRNAVGIGLEPSPFEGMKEIVFFRTDAAKSEGQGKPVDLLIYDMEDPDSYKHFLEGWISLERKNPEMVPHIIKAQLKKWGNRLESLERMDPEVNSAAGFRAHVAKKQEVELVIGYLKGKMEEAAVIPPAAQEGARLVKLPIKPTLRVLALFYAYLEGGGYIRSFAEHPDGKMAGLQELADLYGLKVKKLQIEYNKVFHPNRRVDAELTDREKTHRGDDMAKAIALLKNYPKSHAMAKAELSKFELLK